MDVGCGWDADCGCAASELHASTAGPSSVNSRGLVVLAERCAELAEAIKIERIVEPRQGGEIVQ